MHINPLQDAIISCRLVELHKIAQIRKEKVVSFNLVPHTWYHMWVWCGNELCWELHVIWNSCKVMESIFCSKHQLSLCIYVCRFKNSYLSQINLLHSVFSPKTLNNWTRQQSKTKNWIRIRAFYTCKSSERRHPAGHHFDDQVVHQLHNQTHIFHL